MQPGWNLGNTLDAVETEGSWNNPPVVASTFDDIKAAGFKGVRLPVTWAYHFTSGSPSWDVDAKWLQRVEDVVDMVTQRGFYSIVNVHHDSWVWMDISQSSANITQIEEKFYRLWYQIGTKLACKGSKVAFEPINEIPGSTAEHGLEVNKLNDIFLQAISDAGGFNAKRVVTLVGVGEDSVKTSQWFKRPDAKFKNPWAIQYHYYSPYDFIFGAWGKSTWGSAADKASLDLDLSLIRNNFTDVPLIIGEWSGSATHTETAARWRYVDYFMRAAQKYNTSVVLWDNGADSLNRATHQWRDTVLMDIISNAARGISNALPESTTDGAATKQESSAYVYHKANTSITATTLPFQFNGNTLVSASLASSRTPLTKGKDYTTSGETVTFSAPFLTSVLQPIGARTGSIANVTLKFSAGANLLVNILQYNTPTLGATSSKLSAATPATDLLIPITWAGQNRPAAVKATKADGGYLLDDWTQWLPVLQQGRITYGGQWDWDGSNVVLKAAVVDAVKAAGMDTVFRVEFYPREEGNWVEYTLRV
ncbi:glycoside hydrolase family 5 protein [Amniculicola lignicola CBS 123094]|uniref:Glycoside hydrolase family 5 protein n=1 Tax=Amniculicola lignicola CBS 123094 TaxID=1392246 RepID=A0A6A5X154_9PLEO|nr:glycoside hydrolase family 5 protein [Amniculicola lignicola CBS 123094]